MASEPSLMVELQPLNAAIKVSKSPYYSTDYECTLSRYYVQVICLKINFKRQW